MRAVISRVLIKTNYFCKGNESALVQSRMLHRVRKDAFTHTRPHASRGSDRVGDLDGVDSNRFPFGLGFDPCLSGSS